MNLKILAMSLPLVLSSCRIHENLSPTELLEAGLTSQQVCVGSRHFSDPAPVGFDFQGDPQSLKNAYWMTVLAFDAYLTKDLAIGELGKIGLPNAQFFDEDGIARNFLLTGLNFHWASTQGYWVEKPEGVVLAFRGTSRGELVDLITDLWSAQETLVHFGEQTVEPTDASIKIHKGFWNALAIVWKDIEQHARDLYASERPKERQAKQARLDQLAARLQQIGANALKIELNNDNDWRIDAAGKINFLKTWSSLGTNKAKRDELFEFLDQNWVSWQKPVYITGHSLGGGLATVAAYRLMKMGLNIKGLYTFGSPRVGNGAFVHDFRTLAYRKGLKTQATPDALGDGGLHRFVNHNDVVARVPPPLGIFGINDNAVISDEVNGWQHVSSMLYLTGPDEAPTQQLWRAGVTADAPQFAQHFVPSVLGDLPLENWYEWGKDHNPRNYAVAVEQVAFGTQTLCP